MARIKASEADRIVQNPPGQYCVFLVYGPDTGLVTERADSIVKNSELPKDDGFGVLRLAADDAAAPGRLVEEASTPSMFGGQRLIRIAGTTRKNLARAIGTLLDDPPFDCRVIVEAGELRADAPLRKQVEKNERAVAIPCYQDGPREIDRLISTQLTSEGLSIDADARQVLASMLGSDRLASRRELEKLALYCKGRDTVTSHDVLAIIGDTSAIAVEDLADRIMTGERDAIVHRYRRLLDTGVQPDLIALAVLRGFQTLHLIVCHVESGKSAVDALGLIRAPMHFSRRDALRKAAQRWSKSQVAGALTQLDENVFECRRNPALAASLTERIILRLALIAARGPVRDHA